MKVLLVDDEPDFLERAQAFLESERDRLNVETAPSAVEALDLMKEGDYDAVVSGYQMPGMDGLEFLRVLRERRGSGVPFILFTGGGREEVAMEAVNLGVNRCLQKDGDPKSQYGALAEAILTVVEQRGTEERYRTMTDDVLNSSDVAIFILDPDSNVVWANRATEEYLGVRREDVIGKNKKKLVEGQIKHNFERPDRFEERATAPYEDAHVEKFECHVLPDPEVGRRERWLEHWSQPIESGLYAGGRIEHYKDVTERKEAEEKLERYETGVEASEDSIYMIDKDFRYVFANDEHVSRLAEDGKISEKSREEVVGRGYGNVHSEEEFEAFRENFRKAFETGEPRREEYEFLRKDRWSSRTYSPVRSSDSGETEGVVVVSKDITERRKSRLELESVLRSSGDSIYMTDEDCRYVFVNDELLSRLGKKKEKVLGSRFHEHHSVEESKEFEKLVKKVYETGEQVKHEHEREDLGKWFLRTLSPVKHPETEKVQAAVVVSKDITERKEAREREELLHSLLRHDVGNNIQIVRSSLELLQDLDLPGRAEDHVERASRAVANGVNLIDEVKTLRKIETGEEAGRVSVLPAVEGAVSENESKASERGIEIERSRDDIKGEVRGGPLLKELFANVVDNSIRHSGGSRVRISGEETGGELVVVIEDDGKGIPRKYRDKIFERWHGRGKTAGSGLGLYLVKEIAETYGGSVEAKDSELGGARFDVRLKRA